MSFRAPFRVLLCISMTAACSSHSGTNADNASGGAGVSLVTGGSGSKSTGNGIRYAESTTDGLSQIDPAAAAALISDPAVTCSGWSAEPESNGSILEFIVDVSSSMDKTTSGTNGATKWEVTRQALRSALGTLRSGTSAGLTFFPNMPIVASAVPRPVTACVNAADNVAIAPIDDAQTQKLLAALDGLQMRINEATPTHDAYNLALTELKAYAGTENKYLVLITDGQPTQSLGCVGTGRTCSPEPTEPVVQAVANAYQTDNIHTFVVGSPGSEKNECTNTDVRSWLSAAARSGATSTSGCSDTGSPYCHFDLSQSNDFGGALSSALSKIIQSAIGCEFDVPPAPSGQTLDTDLVNLMYHGGNGDYYLVLPSQSQSCTLGWQFTDASKTKLHVCDTTCKLLQSDPEAQLTLMFGCSQSQVNTPLL